MCSTARAWTTEHVPVGRTIILHDGRRLSYQEYGDPGGLPVLYWHGVPGSSVDLAFAQEEARELGLRLIAADRPGYGYSDATPRPNPWQVAIDNAALLAELGVRTVSLLAFSGASRYALTCAAELGAAVRRIVLVGAMAPLGDERLLDGMSAANRQLFALAGGNRDACAAALAPVLRDPDSLLAALMAGLPAPDRSLFEERVRYAYFHRSCERALRQGPRAFLDELAFLTTPWDLPFDTVRCPALLWHGLADENLPAAMGRYLASKLPIAEVRFVAGAGHFFMWKEARAVLRSLL